MRKSRGGRGGRRSGRGRSDGRQADQRGGSPLDEWFKKEALDHHRRTKREKPPIPPIVQPAPSARLSTTLKKAKDSRDANGQPRDSSLANKRKNRFSELLSDEQILSLVERGEVVTGQLRVNPHSGRDAYVTVDQFEVDVMLEAPAQRNRAFHGDTVAVKLYPKDKWRPVEHKENVVHRKPSDGDDDDKEAKKDAPLLRPLGEVVGVVKHGHSEELIGTLKPSRGGSDWIAKKGMIWAQFTPFTKTMPRMVVPFSSALLSKYETKGNRLQDMIVLVRIEKWEITNVMPKGSLVRVLGRGGDIGVEIAAALAGEGITWGPLDTSLQPPGSRAPDTFPPEVLAALPQDVGEAWEVPADVLKERTDLRELRVFSIDPTSARDLDDALSVRHVGPGCVEVGVHIADVTHFVRAGGPLDLEARKRATTVYLPHLSIPMLPRQLSEGLCSLHPGGDKLAFSCTWQFNMDTCREVPNTRWFGKSVVRSRCKLDYATARRILEGEYDDLKERYPSSGGSSAIHHDPLPRVGACILDPRFGGIEEVAQDLKVLHALSQQLRKDRFAAGSLTLDDTEISFTFGEDGFPQGVRVYEQSDSNALVEEFMLLANRSVADRVYRFFCAGPQAKSDKEEAAMLDSDGEQDIDTEEEEGEGEEEDVAREVLLRHHPNPNARKLASFMEVCNAHGIEVDASTSKTLQDSLEHIGRERGDVARAVMTQLATIPMNTAAYVVVDPETPVEGYRHYALAFPMYTHFTSPIRRYPDVVVHHLLQAALTHSSPREVPPLWGGKSLTEVCSVCNERRASADKAEDRCKEVFLCTLLKDQPELGLCEAWVTEQSKKWFKVLVPSLGIDRRIFLEDMANAIENHEWHEATTERPFHSIKWKTGAQQELSIFAPVSVRAVPNYKKKPCEVRFLLLPPE